VRPKLLGLALALAALIPLAGAFTRPSPPALSTNITGDADLAAQARPLLPGALDRVSIAVVDGSTVTYAKCERRNRIRDRLDHEDVYRIASRGRDRARRGHCRHKTWRTPSARRRTGRRRDARGARQPSLWTLGARHAARRDVRLFEPRDGLARARAGCRGAKRLCHPRSAACAHATRDVRHHAAAHGEGLPNRRPTGYSADGVAEAPWTIDGWAPAGARARRQRTWCAMHGRSSTALHRAWTR
jgi:hypothetical protein